MMCLRPFLITSILCLFVVFTQAQKQGGSKMLLAEDFATLKGNLPWPADNISELVTHKQAVANVKKEFNINLTPLKTLTIRCEEPALIKAVAEGTVQRIFNIEDSWSVLVKHGDYMLVYSNLDTVFLKNGDVLSTRQPVGMITHQSLNNYFELEMLLYKNKKDLDPIDWFKPMESSDRTL